MAQLVPLACRQWLVQFRLVCPLLAAFPHQRGPYPASPVRGILGLSTWGSLSSLGELLMPPFPYLQFKGSTVPSKSQISESSNRDARCTYKEYAMLYIVLSFLT